MSGVSRARTQTYVLPHAQVAAVDADALRLERRAGVREQAVALVDAEEGLGRSEEGDGGPERGGWPEERACRSERGVQHGCEMSGE